jgi:hypothetical protein
MNPPVPPTPYEEERQDSGFVSDVLANNPLSSPHALDVLQVPVEVEKVELVANCFGSMYAAIDLSPNESSRGLGSWERHYGSF